MGVLRQWRPRAVFGSARAREAAVWCLVATAIAGTLGLILALVATPIGAPKAGLGLAVLWIALCAVLSRVVREQPSLFELTTHSVRVRTDGHLREVLLDWIVEITVVTVDARRDVGHVFLWAEDSDRDHKAALRRLKLRMRGSETWVVPAREPVILWNVEHPAALAAAVTRTRAGLPILETGPYR